MPWTSKDATKHTHLAKDDRLQKMWASVANSGLDEHGDEARAIKAANAVVHREAMKRSKKRTGIA